MAGSYFRWIAFYSYAHAICYEKDAKRQFQLISDCDKAFSPYFEDWYNRLERQIRKTSGHEQAEHVLKLYYKNKLSENDYRDD